MDVTTLPFNRFLGLEPADEASGALVSLPAGKQYTNHLGTVHASALLAVAEAASGAFLARQFEDTAAYVPVVRRIEAMFRNPARGRVSARTHVEPDDLERQLTRLRDRGRCLIMVLVEVQDESGVLALNARVEWFISRVAQGP